MLLAASAKSVLILVAITFVMLLLPVGFLFMVSKVMQALEITQKNTAQDLLQAAQLCENDRCGCLNHAGACYCSQCGARLSEVQ